jgi:hypothetical protein
MPKVILAALLALAVAVPAAALAADEAPSPVDLAKAACKSEKAQMGANTFKATYAAGSVSGATKTCVAKRDGGAATDLKNAAKECKEERAADAAAFTQKYGTNKNGKNAYGKCVSATARGATEQQTTARVNAANTCKKLKAQDKAAFEVAYGTKKNAFGKCVSKTAKVS